MQKVSWCALLVALACAGVASGVNTRLKEVYAWREVSFTFPSAEAEEAAKASGAYVPANNLPLGLDVSGNRLFVTVPRWKEGVAASLTVIDLDEHKEKSPPLTPYPSWEANELPSENATEEEKSKKIISVFRVRADQCKRLWVMDTGVADVLGKHVRYTPPKLMVYDLKTDTLIRTFNLKDSDVKEDSFFANVVVDTDKDDCENTYAYLPDLGSYALVVYDWKANESWRIKHHFFYFDPLQGNHRAGGVNYQWTDGLFGLALSPRNPDGYRTLYFHPLSSTHEFAVSTQVVQNKTGHSDYYAYRDLGSKGNNTQATASFLHEPTGILFYTQINRNGIGCWNTNKPFSEETQGLVAEDDQTLVFPNDLKVCGGNNLWVLSDKLPQFVYRDLNPEEVNYRIFRAPVAEAVKGTVCE